MIDWYTRMYFKDEDDYEKEMFDGELAKIWEKLNTWPAFSCEDMKESAHIPTHTVILGPTIRGQPKTNLKLTF